MEGLDLLHTEQWYPFSVIGLHHPFFAINADTVINTWIVIGFLILMIIPLQSILARQDSLARFLILSAMDSFKSMIEQALGTFSLKHFNFITALFIFIATANCLMIIPFLEEPTKDINTTLALSLISFLYVQGNSIHTHGIVHYLKEFTTPFFVMFPLHIMGKLSTVFSMALRLFGNIFGGATIATIYFSTMRKSLLLGLLGAGPGLVIMLFFGIFEGFLQAYVFTMLSITYLSIELQGQEGL